MGGLPDPDWYIDHVLAYAEPGRVEPLDLRPVASWRRWWEQRHDELARHHPDLATAAGFVATSAQLAERGVPRHEVRRRVRRGEWWVPRRGVVAFVPVEGTGPDVARRRHALIAAAGVAANPHASVGYRSAAILAGLPTGAVPSLPELALALPTAGHRLRPSVLPPDAGTSWFGVPVTTVPRTLVDVARHDRRDAVMAADAALRESLVRPDQINAALEAARGWVGVKQARAVLALADPLSESPLESVTRLAIHDAGLPAPQLQVEIAGYRADMLWASARLVLECDGRIKYDRDELWREKLRENDLRRAGYRVERVVWADIVRHWDRTHATLAAALGR